MPLHDPDKSFTLGDLIDNMERNGYEQAYGKLMVSDIGSYPKSKSSVTQACALGQGMLNLDVRSTNTRSIADYFIFEKLVDRVAHLNDVDRKTPDKIAKIVREEFKDNLDILLDGYTFDSGKEANAPSLR